MNSATFHTLLKNSSSLHAEEINELRAWNAQYPYCQIMHLLLARGTRDIKEADAQDMLHRAAVYAGDRTVVKSVMTAPVRTRVVVPVIKEASKMAVPAQPKKSEETSSHVAPMSIVKDESRAASTAVSPARESVTLEGDELRADLTAELHRLHHLMSAFEASYEQLKNNQPATPPAKAQKKSTVKSATPEPPGDTPEAPLIEEIKSSKRKPKLVSPKVAEQGEIIDHFIKVAPTLPRTKPSEPAADLSEESVNYGDHIVSETLVEILLKQGKKAKAIEMLKKLIWKFPQKKAYFAAQIEALKS